MKLLRIMSAALLAMLFGVSAGPVYAATVNGVNPTCDATNILPRDLAVSTSAVWKPAVGDLPAYCEVSAILSPASGSHIGVVYRLPDHWNGRLLGLGGGGQAGNVTLEFAAEPLRLGYATAQTDAGHPSSNPWNTDWSMLANGEVNWPSVEDFAYRAIHVMTVAGKDVVEHHYGKRADHAYFQGCSTGGRQALMEAQRFPADYDGIISGAPVYDQRVANSLVNSGRAFADPASKLDTAAIALVNAAVLRACDGLDGLADGIVTDPGRCHWDPAELACRGTTHDCLTDQQVIAVRRAYDPIHSPDGRTAAFGLPRGAELSAFPLYMKWGGDLPNIVGMTQERAFTFEDPQYNFSNWDVGRDYFRIRTTPFALIYDAANPDLSEFVARGGRLIVWHGLYDQLPRAPATIEYVRRATAVTDALLAAQGSENKAATGIRLFLLPGVSHCTGGPGADSFDGLDAITTWVEKGSPPDHLTAVRQDKELPMAQAARVKGAPILMSRPMCAYPDLPYYRGKGDPSRAESFICSPNAVVPLKTSAAGSKTGLNTG
jgi:feruloyl esterase